MPTGKADQIQKSILEGIFNSAGQFFLPGLIFLNKSANNKIAFGICSRYLHSSVQLLIN